MTTRTLAKTLFLSGLLVYTCGQILINLGPEFTDNQRPIDYAHWLLLIGVLLLIPLTARLPRDWFSYIGAPILIVGIACVIGMCVLDFIFWSLPTSEQKQKLATHLINTPAIWTPFITVGPNIIFNVGLLLPSLSYFRRSKVGTILVIAGSLVIFIGTQWFNVIGYVIVLVGYSMNLLTRWR